MVTEGEVYYIQTRLNGKNVDLEYSRTDNGTNIHLWTSNKTNAQKFRIVKNGDYYSFLSLCNESKAIDGGGNNYNIHIWDYSEDNDNQKWELKKIEDEWNVLICKSNNRVMDIYGANLGDGTNIFCCEDKHFKPNQQFRFININNQFFDSSILSKVTFSCTIRQGGCTKYNLHHNLSVDAATENNGKLQLWDKVNGAQNQKWDFIGVGPDIYYIRSCSQNLYYPFICNINNFEVKYKLFDGKMDDEFKWKLINQGKKMNKDSFLFQNIKTNNYLDSGPHDNHKCGGVIYTNKRCGAEQIFLLSGEEDISKNNINNYDNNIKKDGLILQKNFKINAIRKTGCLFLACCFVGGLTSYDQCISAYYWASKLGKIKGNNCYVNMDSNKFSKEISDKYRTTFKEGCDYAKNSHHFWVVKNGVEIYNSCGIGWRGR